MASSSRVPHMLVSAIIISLMLIIISHAMGESAQEKEKCVEQLQSMTTCLPYVGGSAKAPTPDCCSGLIQVMKNNKKCICIVLKDRDDPDLGLKISIRLALGLPSLCKAPDNLSQCPSLLHLDPKSTEAQAFNQLGPNSNGSSISPFTSPSGSDPFDNRFIFNFGKSVNHAVLNSQTIWAVQLRSDAHLSILANQIQNL